MKKPNCPICDAKIQLSTISISSNNGGDSNWMGNGEMIRYLCSHSSDICHLSREIYTVVTGKVLSSNQSKNWRKALSCFIEYVEFCEDNELQQKLLSNSNEYGELDSKTRSFLLDEARANQINQ